MLQRIIEAALNFMTELFFKYYYDITKYNVLVSILVFILTQQLFAGVLSFGTFGMAISLALYRHYQNIEYYFYLNAGLSKKIMILNAFIINLVISIILSAILWIIH